MAPATCWNNPAADRTAVINTPGGGASRNTRRPDLVPGVDPFIKDGGLLFLNPAAFATPQPGTFGNLERNSIHGPSFRQIDMVVAKRVELGRGRTSSCASEIFNLFNVTNFANPDRATLPNALPGAGESVDPGQPRAARPAVHRGHRRHLRPADQHRRTDRRTRARIGRCSSRFGWGSDQSRVVLEFGGFAKGSMECRPSNLYDHRGTE